VENPFFAVRKQWSSVVDLCIFSAIHNTLSSKSHQAVSPILPFSQKQIKSNSSRNHLEPVRLDLLLICS
jgi:hypothetical protein